MIAVRWFSELETEMRRPWFGFLGGGVKDSHVPATFISDSWSHIYEAKTLAIRLKLTVFNVF
jgi:hypothetical protein